MLDQRAEIYAIDTRKIDTTFRQDLDCRILPSEGAYCELYGWHEDPEPVDAGPSALLEGMFAAALVKCGTLAFRVEEGPLPWSNWVTTNEGSRLRFLRTLIDVIIRRIPPSSIFATDSANHAQKMFIDGAYWSRQQQVGFLLKRGKLPLLGRQLIVKIIVERGLSLSAFNNLPDEVIALILPAVGGDFMEVAARRPSTLETIRAAVSEECRIRGIPFSTRETLSPGDTMARNSSAQKPPAVHANPGRGNESR